MRPRRILAEHPNALLDAAAVLVGAGLAVWSVAFTQVAGSTAVAFPLVLLAYLATTVGLTLAVVQPTIAGFSRSATEHRPGRPTALVLCTISPAILATAVPVRDTLDTAVRAALVTGLLVLLFARLTRTMSALTRAEADSRYRATHDALTGLINRAALLDMLERRLRRDAAAERATAVLFLDCDDFKRVNDTWGHHAGNTLLCQIADLLPAHLGPGAVLARHGGDEFVVVAPVTGREGSAALAERIRRFFDTPLRILPDRVHAVTPSIGVVMAEPGETVTTEELLGRADVAMYEAKTTGRGRCIEFGPRLAERARLRAAVVDRLEAAIRDEEFTLELQPIKGGLDHITMIGWESLARWHDPELGDIAPDVFIPLAEQLGLIGRLGEVVLRRACRELAELSAVYPDEPLTMSVNVSPAQLMRPDFATTVFRAQAEAGIPRDRLWLELTETMLVDGSPAVLEVIGDLRAAGVCVAIDDFGSGYASLATLLRLPVDCVKLDRSLVEGVGVDENATRHVGALLAFVDSLGIANVVAEGVETAQQAEALRRLGCPLVQGWYFGRPTTVEALLDESAAAGDQDRARILR
ncbi:putative bifunctional diguanylate cyclase/phosphodiesterase [Mobilicoccus massiliensis]|uniref:putative bifunctional diguanylate cyclase/phosphodiesterase n=1 Tax=Mobilicoccus massiliensis TaxID=1522310 RepID=UPI000693C4C9|nr:bifunctional diguanylate cyclase/phosphodiesterase [Mobilicoccus massiliensis]